MRVPIVVGLLLITMPAAGQVEVQIAAPSITFEAPPPLVVVQPGVQVVQNYKEEVFVVDGFYWVRHGKHWYRSANHQGGWVVAEAPPVLVKMPRGKFKHYKGRGAVMVAPGGEGVGVKMKKVKMKKMKRKRH